MTCAHDITEREVAVVADGYCPLCMAIELEHLRRFVDFANLWCHRGGKLSDSERVSVIKFHPTAQAALKKRPVG